MGNRSTNIAVLVIAIVASVIVVGSIGIATYFAVRKPRYKLMNPLQKY
jgi:hypothetical protein